MNVGDVVAVFVKDENIVINGEITFVHTNGDVSLDRRKRTGMMEHGANVRHKIEDILLPVDDVLTIPDGNYKKIDISLDYKLKRLVCDNVTTEQRFDVAFESLLSLKMPRIIKGYLRVSTEGEGVKKFENMASSVATDMAVHMDGATLHQFPKMLHGDIDIYGTGIVNMLSLLNSGCRMFSIDKVLKTQKNPKRNVGVFRNKLALIQEGNKKLATMEFIV